MRFVPKKYHDENYPDPAPVVRCKDCKHHTREQEPCHGRTEHYCKRLSIQVSADFYCAAGAKKPTTSISTPRRHDGSSYR